VWAVAASVSGTLARMPIVGDLLAGRYRIDGLLGAGGMASVYRATDLRLDRSVAVKVLSANLAADATLAQRFEREARALAAAAHPAVVAVFDVEPGDPKTGREPFYVMELCDGGSLADRLAANGRLEAEELVSTMVTVAEGLAELHRRGIVHRDVKPANIVYLDDRPKLADFGLARSEEQDLTTLTAKGMTVGTLTYLAPELLAGAAATAASDVYALGVAAFQGLTGRLPRSATSIGELIETRRLPLPMVASVAPELGTAFDAIVGAALAVEPSERPSADAFSSDLAEALLDRSGRATSEAPDRSITSRPFFEEADPFPDTVASVPVAAEAVRLDGVAEASGTDGTIVHATPDAASPTPIPPAARVDNRHRVRAAGARPRGERPSRGLLERPGLIVVAAFGIVVLILAALSTILGGPNPGASLPAVIAGSSSPLPGSLSPSPSPSLPTGPSPSRVVTPSLDPAARALAALDQVDAAIAGARGAGGLKGKEANELERMAADVGTALRARDFEKARERAGNLEEKVEKVEDELDRTRWARLRNAVAGLIDAIPDG
jgi:serine/threonine protein kinase